MPRSYKSTEVYLKPDPRYGSRLASKIINKLMWGGKKSTAQAIFYSAMEMVAKKVQAEPDEIVTKVIENIKPRLEVRSKRVGGATYQVPVEVRTDRRQALAIRWIIGISRKRGEHTMTDRLAAELLDAANNRGLAVKKREDTHRMAEANKAFSHYRW